ncbi:exopolysaccharide production repressor protein [Aminobacter sp. BA135]|uniref:exopolysaccharide production repressor protein n=1 Tax=Aminobacter sp. BA135 TaxID=537596 RepID=UPI003D79367E
MRAAALAAEPAAASAQRTARPMSRPTRSQHELHDLTRQTRRTALNFMIFCRLLALLLCGTAATVYFASQSIRLTVVATLGCSLLLQMVYFASVLFLIWRSSCAGKAGQGKTHGLSGPTATKVASLRHLPR